MATVLVVDDRATNRKLLSSLLGYAGHRVVEAANGRAALTLARAERPALVISDILMPEMDGVELVRRLRADPELAATPVLFYTATYRHAEAEELSRDLGLRGVLAKPSAPAIILAAVDDALGLSPTAAPGQAGNHEGLQARLQLLDRDLPQLQAMALRLATIVELGPELVASRDPEALLAAFCRTAQQVVGGRYAALCVGGDGERRCVVTRGLPPEIADALKAPLADGTPLATVVREERPVRLRDLPGDPAAVGLPPEHPPVHTFLALPLSSSHATHGWLYVAEPIAADEFSDDEERLALTLATQAAVAYENAMYAAQAERHAVDLEREVVERRRAETVLAERARLAALAADVGKALIAGEQLRPTLQLCAECLVRHLGAAFARIWTVDAAGTTLELHASAGMYTRLDGKYSRVAIGERKIGRIATRREPHLTNAVLEDPLVDRAWARREEMVAFAGYPLVIDGRLMGVMALFARQPLTDFTLDALASVANEIALGIERKRAVEELARRETRFRAFALTGAQIVWTTNANGEIVEEMPGWKDYTGQSWEEYREGGWAAAIHPDSLERVLEAWARAVATGTPYEFETRLRAADGSYGIFEVRGVPVRDADGSVREWVGTCIDVTERKSLEEQLRQAQKMEAIGRLAGGIAHDFNNLLTVILGYGSVVAGRVAPDLEASRNLEEMLLAAERAATLTRQLLSFSRRQVLQPRLVDLNAVVRGVEQMLHRLLGEDVELRAELAPDLGRVLADAGQVEQVLVNLAVNARDAMPGGGRLTIATSDRELDAAYAAEHVDVQPGHYVELAVTDTGTGIEPEVLSHLFEPFFTTKETGKGTGLGLATSYGIVRQSGGHIWVYSEPGRGACFKIYLPRAEAPAAAARREAVSAPGRGREETVLLVEDDSTLRRLARTVLDGQGYRVMEADSAAAALEAVAAHQGRIDLLLTDVVMPGLGGPDLGRRLRAELPGLKVLLMSGYADDAVGRHGVLDAGTAFLQKPFNAAGLARKVREVLDAPAPG
ncbi:MAG TPA: response regulator [Thermoanaerobaculia bacterium]